ncbi:hypothetical protein A3C23_04575 [Candidatus Roizmanbacteria bacterium RIFCSPHIGHO2_02_FULL_37_13b]|uniref:Ribose-5-phosphate isomerase n=1 Tax=Candidatus Roizmanbacteria bacterium RIFCSPLOWO2_02_FULL_36_11 TaxID=1802071 RepID=A0A1F7JH99_9BACT|nr:MAG: hypothetical protein A3C23_04575 [Candidatus Roizmanbacteria bacterium RIFCSPHIGHO2_02_FULL_37_13b]OGK54983.1 MAG: hypothetical protein A3H78_00720 [Candidatus Roizmanbacteria bacterium RIFCSPLOWO2_02_FULL_36_11]
MKIYIGSDHRGFELKNKLVGWLKEQDHEISDCGNLVYDPQDDYPDFARKVAQNVTTSTVILNSIQDPINTNKMPKQIRHDIKTAPSESLGILICGSGVGVSVMANRFKGIICALGFNVDQVSHARENDHINILSIPSDYVTEEQAKAMINAFLTATPKTGEKYLRRLKKLDN